MNSPSRRAVYAVLEESSDEEEGSNRVLRRRSTVLSRGVAVASLTLNVVLMTTTIYVLSSARSGSLTILNDGSIGKESVKNASTQPLLLESEIEYPNKVSQISLLGERNSGTTWTHAHLEECFGHAIIVKNRLTRHKHWFQHDEVALRQKLLGDDSSRSPGKTLVIAQFRDPIYWVDAMRRKPHHSPMHYGFEKSQWREFIETPWTLPVRPESDEAYIEEFTLKYNATRAVFHPPCHEGFLPHQMMTCLRSPWAIGNTPNLEDEGDNNEQTNKTAYSNYFKIHHPLKKSWPSFSGDKPRYEHHPITGKPYGTLLELRRDKIFNFVQHVQTWDWTTDHVRVERYEDLVANGTLELIKYVEKQTGLEAKCTPFPPQPNRTVHNPWNSDDDEVAYLDYMHKHVDWDAEALIGYFPLN